MFRPTSCFKVLNTNGMMGCPTVQSVGVGCVGKYAGIVWEDVPSIWTWASRCTENLGWSDPVAFKILSCSNVPKLMVM